MKARCEVCMHQCLLEPGQWGRCRARYNHKGKIICGNYGKVTALALDPIEKKPLKRFASGSMILSVGSFGCNLSCPFCQNYQIAATGEQCSFVELSSEELAEKAKASEREGNIGIAFTYNEPLVGYEFVRDTARLVKERGQKTVVVTNGSVSGQAIDEILPWVNAMNIDLKGFTEEYYRKLGGDLETVKAFIKKAASCCHVELTTLVVPGENDDPDQMRKLAGWVASIDKKIPLHVTRFFPRWKMADLPATPVKTVYGLSEIAGEYLEYVFTGNC